MHKYIQKVTKPVPGRDDIFKPTYGVLILPDEVRKTDEDTGLIIDFDSKNKFTTYNSAGMSGTVLAVSDDYKPQLSSGYMPKVGDRVIAIINRTETLKDPFNRVLLVIREMDILATVEPGVELGFSSWNGRE